MAMAGLCLLLMAPRVTTYLLLFLLSYRTLSLATVPPMSMSDTTYWPPVTGVTSKTKKDLAQRLENFWSMVECRGQDRC